MNIKNEAITTTIEDVIHREPGKSNVLLIFIDSNMNRSLSVGIAALDSFSVTRYLGPRIRDIKGALIYRKHILLVSGNAVKKVFSYSEKRVDVPFIDRYKPNKNQVPVPIEAIVYTYEFIGGKCVFKEARF